MSDADDFQRLRYLQLKAKAAQAAKPARVFTGAEERTAEDKKLLESGGGYGADLSKALGLAPGGLGAGAIGVADRALSGIGHGMYNTHLNISDLMSHLPGNSGARVDPQAWQDQEQLYGRTLGADTAAGVGNLTGQAALQAPIAMAGGALAGPALGAALPEWAAGALPSLTMGAEGAAQGAVAAGPGDRGQGALTGLKYGASIPLVGPALSSALQAASGPLKSMGVRMAQTVLGGSKTGVSPEAAEEALRQGVIRFFGTSKGAANRLGDALPQAINAHGQLLTELESQGAVGPNVRGIANELEAKAKDAALNNPGNPAIAREYATQAQRILEASDQAEQAGVAPTARLGLKQAESTKRGLQELARYGDFKEKPINEARKSIASILRQANEDAVSESVAKNPGNVDLQTLASQFVPSKEHLGSLIEANAAAERAAKQGYTLPQLAAELAGATHGGALGAMTHGPFGLLAGPAEAAAIHLARTRGPSSLAALAYGLGSMTPGAGPALLGPSQQLALLSALARDPQTLAQLGLSNAFGRRQVEAR